MYKISLEGRIMLMIFHLNTMKFNFFIECEVLQ